jgi:hypothetical protein
MSDYNLISIDDTVWLTNTGLEAGRPCKTVIPELSRLAIAYQGSQQLALSNKPYTQFIEGLVGEKLTIQIRKVHEDVLDDLATIIDTWITSGNDFRVTLTRNARDYDLQCIGRFDGENKPISHQDNYDLGYYYDVNLNLTVTAVNS